MSNIPAARPLRWLAVALLFAAVIAVFVGFFERIPLENTSFAIDWTAFHTAVQGGDLVYTPTDGLRIPPWSALFVMPLSLFSRTASWGLLALISTALLVFSVPFVHPRWKHWLSIVLLAASFLALRLAVDGNFEGFIVAGAALIVYAYRKEHPGWMALGVLLATFKPQAVVLLLCVIAVDLIAQPARRPFALKAGALTLAVIIPAMLWRGEVWLTALFGENYQNYTGNYLDISLSAALTRFGLPAFVGMAARLVVAAVSLWIAWRPLWKTPHKVSLLSREKAGMLMAASLLVSPYAAGNTVLTVLAIGVIPLLQKRLWLGLALIALSNAAIFIHNPAYVTVVSYYWTAYLVVVWAVLGWMTWAKTPEPSAVIASPALPPVQPIIAIAEAEG